MLMRRKSVFELKIVSPRWFRSGTIYLKHFHHLFDNVVSRAYKPQMLGRLQNNLLKTIWTQQIA